ncbi:MAG: hypothetical protein GY820_11135 [Gammaproteobacteria bacterium]|nr:hypothetical protein [Gammaproteobacteria bacterium]
MYAHAGRKAQRRRRWTFYAAHIVRRYGPWNRLPSAEEFVSNLNWSRHNAPAREL